MLKLLLVTAVLFSVGLIAVNAQDTAQKTQELVAALDKTKYKKKEKRNITIETYVDVRNEAVVKAPSEYSGNYASSEPGYRLELQVGANGSVTGSGYDTVDWNDNARMNFTLQDARIDGALLTGLKVFADGRSEKFEAVFADRTVSYGKNANEIETRDISFGLGFIQSNKDWQNRVFLEKK